ncbi:hypothetical protein SAMN04488066_11148 [Halorubrum aquaticum]|uniref:DUF7978 domain-containing protein n=1 Tax=Halorubrum aquaticum TaxID=387340 RepID=A0A1I3BC40_9EURY|nr:transporter [Halorubrum aquaticum]SFH59710.1 hypothetical protein SAMN04488066_11148 [Halorubrum aquaticum]
MSTTDRSDTTRDLAVGALGGVAAYVLGYLIVFVTQRGRVGESLRGINFVADLIGGDPIPPWKAVGWVFYNAHVVATEVPTPLGGVRVVNFIAESDAGSLAAMYLVPPVLLLVAGVLVGRIAGVTEPIEGVRAGGFVVAGYLPLALVGVLVFGYSIGDGAITPILPTAGLLAGIVYPAVFGAGGGAAASLLADG